MKEITIGIDISKAFLDVATYPGERFNRFANDNKGHKGLLNWLGAFEVKLIVFEATGAYHRDLERFIGTRGWPFAKVNPRQAKRFGQAIGELAKTERADALMLARFGALLEPSPSMNKSQILTTLSELVMARRALVKDRTATKNRLHNLASTLLRRQAKRRLKQIEADIKTIDETCTTLVKADKEMDQRFDILMSILGLGQITAFIMMSQMPELGTMDKRQAAALAGLAPITRQYFCLGSKMGCFPGGGSARGKPG